MDAIYELLVTDVAAGKLGRRGISDEEVAQLLRNANVTVRNPGAGGGAERLLLIGSTNGGRILTLVVERTIEPSAWLVITGWTATEGERKMLRS
jgi:uncharacterized DUF497 family protein